MIDPSLALQQVFDKAVKYALSYQHEYLTLEHLLCVMLEDDEFRESIIGYGSDPDLMKKNLENYVATKLNDIKIDDEKYLAVEIKQIAATLTHEIVNINEEKT